MPKKLSVDYVRSIFEKRGCVLLSEYVSANGKLNYICSNKHVALTRFADFQNGVGCRFCSIERSKRKKLSSEEMVDRLRDFIKCLGYFPSDTDLVAAKRGDLGNFIRRNGGFIYFRRLLGASLVKHPNGYWDNWDVVEKTIKDNFPDLLDSGVLPSTEMLYSAGIPHKVISTFGNVPGLCKRLGVAPYNKLWLTRDGHCVNSWYEVLLDEYLYSRQINHVPNVLIKPIESNYRCDQRLDEHFIEIWGFDGSSHLSRGYKNNRKKKEVYYKRCRFSLIGIEGRSFFRRSLDSVEKELDRLFSRFGYDVDKKLSFSVLGVKNGIWNEDKVIKSLLQLVGKLGHFPSLSEMDSKLRYAVDKFGGVTKLKNKLDHGLGNLC